MWPRCSVAAGGGGGGGGGGGVVGGSGGSRSALWLPYCTQPDRRTPGELVDFSGKAECLKLIRDVNRETSTYRHLAVSLGGSGDCKHLRQELKRSRRRARDVARQAKTKLLSCVLDPRLGPGEKRETERLCRLLFYCIRVLEQELLRTLSLQRSFTLHQEGALSLINTGVNDFGCSHRSGTTPAPDQDPEDGDEPQTDRLFLAKAEFARIQREILELRGMVSDLEGCVDVKAWLEDETACEELLISLEQQQEDEEDEDEDEDEVACHNVSVPSNKEPLQPATGGGVGCGSSSGTEQRVRQRQCLGWVLASLGTTLLVATVFGIFIMVFS
ncbi:regulator of G-protein signaling 9-binding protein-like [Oratosquilla oratoria]|uniref:regulator of G-protein signaling 9-binding protein-like n=1 Tax=Oratosquilla oratoria TaxID=337810 RepID=UPI003F773110